ncbi:MAG: helix-turn-helix transcriptional regulator [Halocynthiibacter sp.]
MSKSLRHHHIMQLLRQLPAPVKARDLAKELSVTIRTIYRDIDSLRQAGAIIDGEAGFGYVLTEDPALPPMLFTQDETECLVLGLREVRAVGDPVLVHAAETALLKLKAALPDRMRAELDHAVLHAHRFGARPEISIDVADLRRAIRQEREIHITYQDAQGVLSQRRILPLSVLYIDNVLLLPSYCKLRSAYRAFRLDRIQGFTKTGIGFRPRRVAMLREFHALHRS